MTEPRPLELEISANLDELVRRSARLHHTDRAKELRRWLDEAATRAALELVAEGRISGTRAAELLDLSIWDILELVRTHQVEIGPTPGQIKKAGEYAERLAKHGEQTSTG